MNRLMMCACLLAVWQSANPALADEVKVIDAATAATASADEKVGASTIYASNYDKIVKDCAVSDPVKQKELHDLLTSWDTDTQSVTASARVVNPNLAQKLEAIDKELHGARAKEDKQMVADLTEKRAMVVDAMGGWHSDAINALQEMDNKYKNAIRALVPEEKIETLDDILASAQEQQTNRPRRGPVRSSRALKAMVDRLGDLTGAQSARIDEAFTRFREVQRASRGRNADETAQLTTLYDEVFAELTEGQKVRIEQQLMGRRATDAPAAPGSPGAAAAPAGGAKSAPATGATPPAQTPPAGKP